MSLDLSMSWSELAVMAVVIIVAIVLLLLVYRWLYLRWPPE